MRITGISTILCILGLGAFTANAGTVTVQASASYTAQLSGSGSWSFGYLSGAPGVYLQSVTIDLGPTGGLAFDTAAGGFGSLSYQDVSNFGGTDVTTGLTGYSPSGAALDGGTLLTFNFNDFVAGDVFQFNADVDHPNPTLTDCTGKRGLVLAACNTANSLKLAAAQTVIANQIADSTVTFVFGGPGYMTGSSTATFGNVTLRDILSNGPGNRLNLSSTVATPEPGSLVLLGGGLLIAGARLWRNKTRRVRS